MYGQYMSNAWAFASFLKLTPKDNKHSPYKKQNKKTYCLFRFGEEMFDDLLDDFFSLCDTFDDNLLDQLINFVGLNLDLCCEFLDFSAHLRNG